jgi:hypothetical protein
MTGPEHYKEAENILARAADADPDSANDDVRMLVEFAQVHATLALAAATASGLHKVGLADEEAVAWFEAVTPDALQ